MIDLDKFMYREFWKCFPFYVFFKTLSGLFFQNYCSFGNFYFFLSNFGITKNALRPLIELRIV